MPQSDVSSGPQILVVEDHDASRELLREVLEYHRFRVAVAAGARDALQMAHGLGLRVIVTDVSFGGAHEDGIWLLEQLRADGLDIPVIAVTGYADRERNLTEAGFTAVLLKPIDIPRLLTVVKDALELV